MKFISFLMVLLVCSCQSSNNEVSEDDTKENVSEILTKKDVQSVKYIEFVADAKVQKVIGSWEKYTELQKVILDVKAANLSFFRDNNEILTVLIDELKTTIPEMVNTPQVMARIIALETTLYKLESNVNLSNAKKETVLSAVKELLLAFSNLNLQMNKKLEKESQNIQKPY